MTHPISWPCRVAAIFAVVAGFFLWQGRTWAYVSCLLSVSALTLYLTLLIYMKLQLPSGAETAAGDEVYAAGGLAIIYLALMLSVFLWLHSRRTHQLSAA